MAGVPWPAMGWYAALLEFFGARFASPELERQYRAHRVSESFLREDGFQTALCLLMCVGFCAGQLVKHGLNGPTAWTAVLFSQPVARALMLGAADRSENFDPASYMRMRAAVAVAGRLLIEPAIVALWFRAWYPAPGEDARAGQLANYVFNASAGGFPVFTALAFPQLVEHHLWSIPASVAIIALVAEADVCSETGPLASPRLRSFFLEAWRSLEAAFRAVLSAVYGQALPAAIEPDARQACRQIVILPHAVLGLGLTLYIIWLMEQRSRAQFLAARGRPWWGAQGPWMPVGSAALHHAVLALVALPVAWKVIGKLQ